MNRSIVELCVWNPLEMKDEKTVKDLEYDLSRWELSAQKYGKQIIPKDRLSDLLNYIYYVHVSPESNQVQYFDVRSMIANIIYFAEKYFNEKIPENMKAIDEEDEIEEDIQQNEEDENQSADESNKPSHQKHPKSREEYEDADIQESEDEDDDNDDNNPQSSPIEKETVPLPNQQPPTTSNEVNTPPQNQATIVHSNVANKEQSKSALSSFKAPRQNAPLDISATLTTSKPVSDLPSASISAVLKSTNATTTTNTASNAESHRNKENASESEKKHKEINKVTNHKTSSASIMDAATGATLKNSKHEDNKHSKSPARKESPKHQPIISEKTTVHKTDSENQKKHQDKTKTSTTAKDIASNHQVRFMMISYINEFRFRNLPPQAIRSKDHLVHLQKQLRTL